VATEIERKFLVSRVPDDLAAYRVEEIEQGYLAVENDEVEVRLRRLGERTLLTVKRGHGLRRTEVEIEISAKGFGDLWPLTEGRRIRKTRHHIQNEMGEIEVDVYRGSLEGLITAEIEFDSEHLSESFQPPGWIGREVTGELGYVNKQLATHGIPTALGGGVSSG
jgi:adenylate cyclase